MGTRKKVRCAWYNRIKEYGWRKSNKKKNNKKCSFESPHKCWLESIDTSNTKYQILVGLDLSGPEINPTPRNCIGPNLEQKRRSYPQKLDRFGKNIDLASEVGLDSDLSIFYI